MISSEEIKKLADLSRIHLEESEIEELRGDIGAILDYVSQVSEVGGSEGTPAAAGEVNVMREDEALHRSGEFSEELITEFPNKDGDYLKVKKIL